MVLSLTTASRSGSTRSSWQPASGPICAGCCPGVDVFDAQGMPRLTGKPSGAPGLYFCGQITVPTGQLREIAIEAERIAASAKAYLRK